MQDISRRETIKKMAGLAGGMGLAALDGHSGTSWLARSPWQTVSVQVSPPGPKSLEVLERVKKTIGRTNYSGLYGISLNGGHGAYIRDVDGNVYLDCLAAAATNVLGCGRAEVAQAYLKAATTLQNSAFGYSPNVQTVELAERLIRITPGNYPKKVLTGLSGSDSCDGAIEAMRKYTNKTGLIKFKNAYHGSTGLSQQASGFRSLNEGIYAPSPEFATLDFPVTVVQRDALLREIGDLLSTGNYGGVMIEPIQGDAGIRVPCEGFFSRLAELATNNKALLIVDEIQSGMGRTGKWWAIEYEAVVPDILLTAKGLSGGYAPISAVIGRTEVLDALTPAQHIFTYTGHSPSAAVAATVLSIIEREGVVANAGRVGERLIRKLKETQGRFPAVIVEARGRGLMIGIEINISKNPLACKVFSTRCVEKGVYVGYFGDAQQVVRIEPPLIITENEADFVAEVIQEVAEEMHTGRIPSSTENKVKRFGIGL